ncbi:hypothetical protein A2U01_0071775, partial [Trifolium medium]|nr:hypothetical protein [Trifolium medium]
PQPEPQGDPDHVAEPVHVAEPQPDAYMWLSHNLTLRLRLRRMTGSSIGEADFQEDDDAVQEGVAGKK